MLLQLKDKLPAHSLLSKEDLSELGIYKLPQVVYQVLYDIGLQCGEDGKPKILKVLLEYIHEKYPGQTLGDFIDLSTQEAINLHHIVRDLDFGLYFTLTSKNTLIR